MPSPFSLSPFSFFSLLVSMEVPLGWPKPGVVARPPWRFR